MDGSPRRTTSAAHNNRQERRGAASPYARRPSPPVSTPSRLVGLLSFLSPFRSINKKKRPPPPLRELSPENNDADHDPIADHQQTREDETFSPAALSDGRDGDEKLMTGIREEIPSSSSNMYSQNHFPKSSSTPLLYESSSFMTPRPQYSYSAEISSGQLQHRNSVSSSSGLRATEELARFFREKAERGDEPLTAVERAGIYQLMQQAQGESLPTAFTPDFTRRSPNSSFFQPDVPTPGPSTSSSIIHNEASVSPFRRRRPIYVGAGYSNQSARRRRHGGLAASLGEGGIVKSQSETTLSDLARTGRSAVFVSEGKRRKGVLGDSSLTQGEDDMSVDSQEKTSLGSVPASFSPSSRPGSDVPPLSHILGSGVINSTPRPSPLWQVSKASTPTPSPPKKELPYRMPTLAADLVMDIIRQEDAARPKINRQDVINPYENVDSPMARLPRSRLARSVTPRKTPSRSVKLALKSPNEQLSPLQTLERTMPAELRRDDKRQRREPAKVEAPPKKANVAAALIPEPPSKKKSSHSSEMEVLQLSDTDASGSDDAEGEPEDDLSTAVARKTTTFSSPFSFSPPTAAIPGVLPRAKSSKATPELSYPSETATANVKSVQLSQPPLPEILSLSSSPFHRPAAPSPLNSRPSLYPSVSDDLLPDDIQKMVLSKHVDELPSIHLSELLIESSSGNDDAEVAYQSLKDLVRRMAPSELPIIRL